MPAMARSVNAASASTRAIRYAGAFKEPEWLPFRVPGVDRCSLGLDEARVFFADPSQIMARFGKEVLFALLAPDEVERHERFRFTADQDLFLVSHALTRSALSYCSQVSPESWRFVKVDAGRPEISAPTSGLRFSLTHTRGLAVCAVAHQLDIGVDAEDTARAAPLAVAPRFLARAELARLQAIPADKQARWFFEYWTLKEAYAKAVGFGLSLSFEQIVFQPTNHPGSQVEWRLQSTPCAGDDPGMWRFYTSMLRDHYRVTLALPCAQRELCIRAFELG